MIGRRVGRPGLIGLAARTAVVAGTAGAVSGAMGAHQQKKAEQQQNNAEQGQQPHPVEAAAPQSVTPKTDLISELQKLAEFHAAGVLTDEEFAAAKAQLLG